MLKVMEKETVASLKEKLGKLGVKKTDNKAALQERLLKWTQHSLNKILFDVVVPPLIQNQDNNFPNVSYEPLEKLNSKLLEWISSSLIYLYFNDSMAVKGHDKGKKLFLCEFIKNSTFHHQGDDIFLKCKCSAETKTTVDYEVKIHLNNREHSITKTECKCPPGKGPRAACKHVGAFLFAVEFYGITGNVKQNVTCTSSLQQWHKPTGSGRQLTRTTVDEMLNIHTPAIEPSEDVAKFYFDSFCRGKCTTALLRKRYCNLKAYLNDHQYCKKNLETIMLDRINTVKFSDIKTIEKRTSKSSRKGIKLWKTRITASIAHYIIRTCRTKRFATSFLKRHINAIPIRSKAIQWGISYESVALREYCDLMGQEFTKCGIFIDTEINYSATPDAISPCGSIIVEIKCPYSARFNKPKSVDYLQGGKLKRSHKYYCQVQMQTHISEVHRCDFVVWTTEGLYVELIRYDAALVKSYLRDIQFYYENVFSVFYYTNVEETV